MNNVLKLLFGEFIKIFNDIKEVISNIKKKRDNASISEKKTIKWYKNNSLMAFPLVGLFALNFLSAGRKILLPKRFQTIASIPNACLPKTWQKILQIKTEVFFFLPKSEDSIMNF